MEEPFITTGDLIPRYPMEGAPEPAESTPADPIPAEESKPVKKESELDIPSWLENLELDEDSQETAVAWSGKYA